MFIFSIRLLSFGYSQQEILIAPNVIGKLVLRLWLSQSILKIGFDEAVEFQPDFYLLYGRGRLWQLIRKMSIFNKAYRDNFIFDYSRTVKDMLKRDTRAYKIFSCVTPNSFGWIKNHFLLISSNLSSLPSNILILAPKKLFFLKK